MKRDYPGFIGVSDSTGRFRSRPGVVVLGQIDDETGAFFRVPYWMGQAVESKMVRAKHQDFKDEYIRKYKPKGSGLFHLGSPFTKKGHAQRKAFNKAWRAHRAAQLRKKARDTRLAYKHKKGLGGLFKKPRSRMHTWWLRTRAKNL